MKLRLVRLNPLTLDPGGFYLMAARNLDGNRINQFPARLEVEVWEGEDWSWQPVEFVNEFAQSDEDNDAREVRSEVQVPVYTGPARNKRSRSDPGGGQS